MLSHADVNSAIFLWVLGWPSLAKSGLYHSGEIRPLLNAEGANIAHRFGKPGASAQGLNGQKQLRHVFAVGHIQTALHPAKTELRQNRAYFGIGLGNAFGVVFEPAPLDEPQR
ncbi:hypothetical protein [Rivihabitans pingtungensis]|uniref:hypothetical protein n=1 Tax=Rivihabitans pingtungensis TaxID=1054498 RepID=UPI003571030B